MRFSALSLRLSFLLLLPGLAWAPLLAADANAEAKAALDRLRGIAVPHGPNSKAEIAALNQRMDDAWGYFKQHPRQLPVAAAVLQMETAAEHPDQFFLLDVSYLLLDKRYPGAEPIAVAALARVDATTEIIQANFEELFHCMMQLGSSGQLPERYLDLVDRFYLNSKTSLKFFKEPHVVDLNPEDIRTLTYGVAGDAAAAHLAHLLPAKTGEDRHKILSQLSALGSERETPVIRSLMAAATDYDTISGCVTVLMQVGGPSGRDAVLALDAKTLEPKARDYVLRIVPKVKEVTYQAIVDELATVASGKLSDREAQKRLDRMEERDGQDEDTPPAAIARSGIPKDKLLAQLKRIRARSFRRENNHVFEDLIITNLLINAVQYR